MQPEKVESILKEHIRLSSGLRELMQEEGKILRSTGSPPDDAFLERKREFLPALDKGIELLQSINDDPQSFPRGMESLVEEARAAILNLMMLDRENERLLMKASLPPKMKEAMAKAAPRRVAQAYEKFSGGKA